MTYIIQNNSICQLLKNLLILEGKNQKFLMINNTIYTIVNKFL